MEGEQISTPLGPVWPASANLSAALRGARSPLNSWERRLGLLHPYILTTQRLALIIIFGYTRRGLQDLSFPTRDWTRPWQWKCQVLTTRPPGDSHGALFWVGVEQPFGELMKRGKLVGMLACAREVSVLTEYIFEIQNCVEIPYLEQK